VSGAGSAPAPAGPPAAMSRREAVRRIALAMGGALVASGAILRGEPAPAKETARAFTDADRALLDEIGETILPQTDIPGAKAAGIGAFMAMMVAECYSEREHAAFAQGLAAIDEASRARFGAPFAAASPEQRAALAADLDRQQAEHGRAKAKGEPAHYFRMMKELTILGYFSSEIGGTRAVRYVEVPGVFRADEPYRKGERAWY
jgi:hypothetical protein